jgi:O-acetyl-ADP-ribose deacetylase
MSLQAVQGELLEQRVDVIVNPWNHKSVPSRLLLLCGVSAAIRERGGMAPFVELRERGPLPLGGATLTSPGRLPFKGIIHVRLRRATEQSIRDSVRNAMILAHREGFQSIAFPVMGDRLLGISHERAKAVMEDELQMIDLPLEVKVVFCKRSKPQPWWLIGFQLIVFCVLVCRLFLHVGLANGGHFLYLLYTVMGVLIFATLFRLIDQFIKQQAQYSIRSMMIVTFCVAVLCSIYSCFGFETVYWLLMFAFLITAARVGKRRDGSG